MLQFGHVAHSLIYEYRNWGEKMENKNKIQGKNLINEINTEATGRKMNDSNFITIKML